MTPGASPCRPGAGRVDQAGQAGVVSLLSQVPGEAATVASLSCQQAPTRGDTRLRHRGLAREARVKTRRGPNMEFWGNTSTGQQRPSNWP